MTLFNFGKKKESVKEPACECNAPAEENYDGGEAFSTGEECCDYTSAGSTGIQSIKVLGAGCKSCHEMYENTKKAVNAVGIEVEVEYVTDMEEVMNYGIMSMPGLVVNEQVVSAGKVLKPTDVEKLLKGN